MNASGLKCLIRLDRNIPENVRQTGNHYLPYSINAKLFVCRELLFRAASVNQTAQHQKTDDEDDRGKGQHDEDLDGAGQKRDKGDDRLKQINDEGENDQNASANACCFQIHDRMLLLEYIHHRVQLNSISKVNGRSTLRCVFDRKIHRRFRTWFVEIAGRSSL